METTMAGDRIRAQAKEFAKELKTEKDLSQFTRMLNRIAVEPALKVEMDDQILFLYAKGMSTRDIVDTFKD